MAKKTELFCHKDWDDILPFSKQAYYQVTVQWSGIIISAVGSNRDFLKVFSVSLPEEY